MRTLTIDQALGLLAAAPERIGAATSRLSPAELRTRPAADEWSVNEVLAHLRSCADVWGDCIATILAEDEPTIRAVNPRTWITQTDYPRLEFQPSFRAFARQRRRLLALLEPLPFEDWSRTATVTGAGSPLRLTVLSYGNRLARHERGHLAHIQRIVRSLHPQATPGARPRRRD